MVRDHEQASSLQGGRWPWLFRSFGCSPLNDMTLPERVFQVRGL